MAFRSVAQFQGMVATWAAQIRFVHLALLGVITIVCVIYFSYVMTPSNYNAINGSIIDARIAKLDRIISVLRPASIKNNLTSYGSHNTFNITSNTSQMNISSIKSPTGIKTILPDGVGSKTTESNHSINNNKKFDLTKGVLTELVYEAGHSEMALQVCPDLGRNITLLIIITSAPSHYAARMSIRETWGVHRLRTDVAMAFMLGAAHSDELATEQQLYGDLIQGNFVDTYDNLTLKTISLLEWADTYCSRAMFLLKTDDDMYINVARLFTVINRLKVEEPAIYGRLARHWAPIRNKKSKYYVSSQQYKPKRFPDFTTGPAYMMPVHIARDLYTRALKKTYLKLEDVFVTGIVADELQIKRIHVSDFTNKRIALSSCNAQKSISIHMVKNIEQYDLWKKLHEPAGARCHL